jgi:hypothetical protein
MSGHSPGLHRSGHSPRLPGPRSRGPTLLAPASLPALSARCRQTQASTIPGAGLCVVPLLVEAGTVWLGTFVGPRAEACFPPLRADDGGFKVPVWQLMQG